MRAAFRKRLLVCLAALTCLALAAWAFRAPLLTDLAKAWVVNEPAAKADAIVVLGGGLENRPLAAAKLFRDGVAPQILYMDVKFGAPEELRNMLSEGAVTHRVLLSTGVPETAMTMIGSNVADTYDESRAVRAWIEKSGAKSIIIPTDPFHTRRARWVFSKELRGTKTEIHVVAIKPLRYEINDWWRHEEGVVNFQNEFIKYIYYRFNY